MAADSLPGGLDPQTFLKRHWQKTPCLIRGAFPNIVPPISPEELAGLACEADVEARIVEKVRRKPGWSVRHSRFTENDFTSLPARNWTLLVQDVDKYVPVLSEMLDCFRFVPNWRIDDLMVSYAADGGGVGPHLDAYDVFLIQVQGFRRWSISTAQHAEVELPGLELKQVRDFKPEQEWLLGPGDMLYLPPGVAHDGIAVGDCLTFSIGFRIPADAEMLADLAGLFIEQADKHSRYTDPDLKDSRDDPGLITESVRRRMRQRLKNLLTLDTQAFDRWFGSFITEPKPWLRPVPPRRKIDATQMRKNLDTHTLIRDPASLLCWAPATASSIYLFTNGRCHELPAGLKSLALMLCRERRYSASMLRKFRRNTAAMRLLSELYNSGVVHRE